MLLVLTGGVFLFLWPWAPTEPGIAASILSIYSTFIPSRPADLNSTRRALPNLRSLPALSPAKVQGSSAEIRIKATPKINEVNRSQVALADSFCPRHPTNLLELQIALSALGISGGSIDGVMGPQTTHALQSFQRRMGLDVTGKPDPASYKAVTLSNHPFIRVIVSKSDLQSVTRIPETWVGKSRLSYMGFESVLEAFSERSHSHPNLVRALNPYVDWNGLVPGVPLTLPRPADIVARRAAQIRISIQSRTLRVLDEAGVMVGHFPCSVGRIASSRPVGVFRVSAIVKDPNYTFDPSMFPESVEARSMKRRLLLSPGPNNPVGTTWIGLDRPGYGIHGTPHPERVGRSESHGCFRLANWNAEYLRQMAWIGMPVRISDAD